jgi:magnesium transporter
VAGARWIDLLDPTAEELLAAVHGLDPEASETLTAASVTGLEPRPLLERHGAYVFGVLVPARPVTQEDRTSYQEVDVVVTTKLLLTVRKTPPDGVPYDPGVLHGAVEQDVSAGELLHRLVDDVAETYLDVVDATYAEIEELEDNIEDWSSQRVRRRLTSLRHELLHARRLVAAKRGTVRRVVDGRLDLGDQGLFPRSLELRFGETYDTLVRAAEDLDVARDLLASVRDHHQSTIAEAQNDVVKKLTVIASLLLLPTLIVGFYGQNFEGAFSRWFWGLGVSSVLIAATTIAQLAFYKWRRWI